VASFLFRVWAGAAMCEASGPPRPLYCCGMPGAHTPSAYAAYRGLERGPRGAHGAWGERSSAGGFTFKHCRRTREPRLLEALWCLKRVTLAERRFRDGMSSKARDDQKLYETSGQRTQDRKEGARKKTQHVVPESDLSSRRCPVCNQSLAQVLFSKNQWKKGDTKSRCSSCIQESERLKQQNLGRKRALSPRPVVQLSSSNGAHANSAKRKKPPLGVRRPRSRSEEEKEAAAKQSDESRETQTKQASGSHPHVADAAEAPPAKKHSRMIKTGASNGARMIRTGASTGARMIRTSTNAGANTGAPGRANGEQKVVTSNQPSSRARKSMGHSAARPSTMAHSAPEPGSSTPRHGDKLKRQRQEKESPVATNQMEVLPVEDEAPHDEVGAGEPDTTAGQEARDSTLGVEQAPGENQERTAAAAAASTGPIPSKGPTAPRRKPMSGQCNTCGKLALEPCGCNATRHSKSLGRRGYVYRHDHGNGPSMLELEGKAGMPGVTLPRGGLVDDSSFKRANALGAAARDSRSLTDDEMLGAGMPADFVIGVYYPGHPLAAPPGPDPAAAQPAVLPAVPGDVVDRLLAVVPDGSKERCRTLVGESHFREAYHTTMGQVTTCTTTDSILHNLSPHCYMCTHH
jgi:hypothetical protein